jgi:hypothetical protein
MLHLQGTAPQLRLFYRFFPSLKDFVDLIPYLPMSHRKAILTITRVQYLPSLTELADPSTHHRWSTLYPTLREFLPPTTAFRMITLHEYLTSLTTYLQSPIASGLISMLVRTLPSNLGIMEEEVEAIREKELQAAMGRYHPQSFHWDSLFEGILQPIAPGYPVSPVYKSVHYSFDQVRETLSSKVFYPQVSDKTIGAEGKQFLIQHRYDVEGVVLEPTTRGLEILYSRTGIMLGGDTEMRTSFSLNDLRPRTYYARGPCVYYPSRFIQSFFNILLDSFAPTNRFSRFITSHIRLDSSTSLFIYDYSSFTSTLFEIRNFTAAIGRYFDGCIVHVVDSYRGVIPVNLADLIADFNEACNCYPSFVVPIDPANPDRHSHNCGMLGVPGNISSCTLLHGVHLAILLSSLLCRCVGDDAIGSVLSEKFVELVERFLTNIGHVSLKKTSDWDILEDEDETVNVTSWHYIKRPISRVANRVHQGQQMIYPPLTFAMGLEDPSRTTVWPQTELSFLDKHLKYCRSFASHARQMTPSSEFDEEVMHKFLEFWKMSLRQHIASVANPALKKMLFEKFNHQLPRLLGEEYFGQAEIDFRKKGLGMVRVKAVPYSDDEWFVAGEEYHGRLCPAISFAVRLEWGRSEEEYEMAYGEDYVQRMMDSLTSRSYRSSYCWSLSNDCPSWLVDLVRSELQPSSMILDSDSDSESDSD